MELKRIFGITLATALLFAACGGGGGEAPSGPPGAPASGNDGSGKAGKTLFTAADISLGDVDPAKVDRGKGIYDVKCQACHSLGPNRVVGPGWEKILDKREPEWVMNMILNIDGMLESDPEAQKLLEECLVRMPNQGLSKQDGLDVLEFMRTL